MMYLVTKWFGTFLFDENILVDFSLFPRDAEKLGRVFIAMRKAEILEQERRLCSGSVVVNESRLSSLGSYEPRNEWFSSVELSFSDYNFSFSLLQQALICCADFFIKEDLQRKDYQIIQMINSIDELYQTQNILQERIQSWNSFPTVEKYIKPVKDLLSQVNEQRDWYEQMVTDEIQSIAPNTSSLIGPILTSRLLSIAGTMRRLACFPASTIQLLGAEKAFFRFKKEGGKPPKHGLIFQHPLINNAPRQCRGRIARLLASKIMLAARADVFTKNLIADQLRASLKQGVMQIKKNK